MREVAGEVPADGEGPAAGDERGPRKQHDARRHDHERHAQHHAERLRLREFLNFR